MNQDSIVKKPSVVVGVVIYNSEGLILLAQIPKWKNMWAVIGGHVEYGESIENCLTREVKEETNLDITNISFIQVQEEIFSDEFTEEKHFIFLNYSALAISDHLIPNEEINRFIWISPSEALKVNLNKSSRILINTFIDKTGSTKA